MNKINLAGKWQYITDQAGAFSIEDIEKKLSSGLLAGQMEVPSNWELQGLTNYNGVVWFITTFDLNSEAASDSHKLLRFGGVDYSCSVWLNGIHLGGHTGYFGSFEFDVTFTLNKENNVLVVRVDSPYESTEGVWPLNKVLIKGIFNHHDCRPGSWDKKHGQDRCTGGIWNDVEIYTFSRSIIRHLKIETRLFENNSKARLLLTGTCYSVAKSVEKYNLLFQLETPSGDIIKQNAVVVITPGEGSFRYTIEIDKPELWWCHDTGTPSLYRITISGTETEEFTAVFGIREVNLDKDSVFRINGKRLYLKGTNIIPEQFLSSLTPGRISGMVDMMVKANINIVRVHAHVNRKEFYEECDRRGLMVWQDFALQWTYDDSTDFVSEAVTQIKEMVRQNINHPSIAFWCCHNEPGNQIYKLDPFLYDAVLSEDNSRIVRLASNYEEHPYDGWYWGTAEHYISVPMGPLVTEFGAQALPDADSLRKFIPEDQLFPPDWNFWKYHDFQYEQTFQIAKIKPGGSIEEFVSNSQAYQAYVIKTAIDFYRREKYGKSTGVFQFMFIDCWESITWSVVDYFGKPKAGYYALQHAFQPLYISIRIRRDTYLPGRNLMFDFWVINDYHSSYAGCRIEIRLSDNKISEIDGVEIPGDGINYYHWEHFTAGIPQDIAFGEHTVYVRLIAAEGKVLTESDFNIAVEEPPHNLLYLS